MAVKKAPPPPRPPSVSIGASLKGALKNGVTPPPPTPRASRTDIEEAELSGELKAVAHAIRDVAEQVR